MHPTGMDRGAFLYDPGSTREILEQPVDYTAVDSKYCTYVRWAKKKKSTIFPGLADCTMASLTDCSTAPLVPLSAIEVGDASSSSKLYSSERCRQPTSKARYSMLSSLLLHADILPVLYVCICRSPLGPHFTLPRVLCCN